MIFCPLTSRCSCSLRNGKSNEIENMSIIARNSRVISTIKPSHIYINKRETVLNRTFFSTPFDNVLKGKKKEYSERKVLG